MSEAFHDFVRIHDRYGRMEGVISFDARNVMKLNKVAARVLGRQIAVAIIIIESSLIKKPRKNRKKVSRWNLESAKVTREKYSFNAGENTPELLIAAGTNSRMQSLLD